MLAKKLAQARAGRDIQLIGAVTSYVQTAASGTDDVSTTSLGLVENDFLIAVHGVTIGSDLTAATNYGIASGWTQIADLYRSDTYSTNLYAGWLRCTSSPPTSVSFLKGGSTGHASLAAILAFRNVNTTTGLDVTSTTVTSFNGNNADAVTILPTTAGSKVVVVYAGAGVDSSTSLAGLKTGPANLTGIFLGGTNGAGSWTSQGYLGAGWSSWASGNFNPAAVTGTGSGGTDSWGAVTMALRVK